MLLCQAALFRSSDAILKATESHFRENTVPVGRGAPHIVSAWWFEHAFFNSKCGCDFALACRARKQQTRRKVRFRTHFTFSEAPGSGEGAQVCCLRLVCQASDLRFLEQSKCFFGRGNDELRDAQQRSDGKTPEDASDHACIRLVSFDR